MLRLGLLLGGGVLLLASCSVTTEADAGSGVGTETGVAQGPEPSESPPPGSSPTTVTEDYSSFVAAPNQIGLHWKDDDGETYNQLERLRRALELEDKRVLLLANAGIYLPGLIPAGLHVQDGEELRPLNLADGEGNFQLLPNGVFFIADGSAGVLESNAYAAAGISPSLAVQSGPQLLLDGELHPAFSETSTSRFVRNGVGVDPEGNVLFLLSRRPVTFWEFANEFLDRGVTDALYLDGSISAMDEPVDGEPLRPNIPFAAMLSVTE